MAAHIRWGLTVLLLGSLLLACGNGDPAVPAGIGQGNRAPDFQLKTLDGQEVGLEDYRGSVVLLNFWATWCAPCVEEVPALEAVYRARQDDGFVVLGVNFQESPQEIEPFVEARDVSYPILLDSNGQVMKTFRAAGLPVSLLIDREGVIQVRHTGLLTGTQLTGRKTGIRPSMAPRMRPPTSAPVGLPRPPRPVRLAVSRRRAGLRGPAWPSRPRAAP